MYCQKQTGCSCQLDPIQLQYLMAQFTGGFSDGVDVLDNLVLHRTKKVAICEIRSSYWKKQILTKLNFEAITLH